MTSQPPTSGPIRKAMPVHAVQVPIAAPRSSPLKTTVIVASAAGVRSAPATPCRRARDDQRRPVRRGRAEDRGDAERDDADQEDPPLPEEVAERAADEDQRAEREQVGVDDPLLEREPAAEVVLDRGQRDVHDRGVDEHDHRPEDAGRRASAACASLRSDADTSRTTGQAGRRLICPATRSRRLEDVPTTCSATTPARCGCSPGGLEQRAGGADLPADAAAHGRQGLVRPPARRAGGDLLRHLGEAAVQARRRRGRVRARDGGQGRARGVPLGLERRARGGASS